jgi:hypothetical protein
MIPSLAQVVKYPQRQLLPPVRVPTNLPASGALRVLELDDALDSGLSVPAWKKVSSL